MGTLRAERAQPRAGEAREDGDEQYLQQIAGNEGAEQRVGDDLQQLIGEACRSLSTLGVLRRHGGIERAWVDVEAGTRPGDSGDHQPYDQRQR
jgi:hypothetical protein